MKGIKSLSFIEDEKTVNQVDGKHANLRREK